MLDLMLLLFAAVTIYLFIHKLVYKRRMQRRLGRKVEDRELTSLTSWMEAPPDEKREGK
jgi:hypothetical protein